MLYQIHLSGYCLKRSEPGTLFDMLILQLRNPELRTPKLLLVFLLSSWKPSKVISTGLFLRTSDQRLRTKLTVRTIRAAAQILIFTTSCLLLTPFSDVNNNLVL
ncbi:hypothetical protein HAX54_042788 [Datura stramonium]|uniref:Uncharacterized protein n=1 Tax=Datura stramonium TaxID=4076 RepID=A0ABS8SMA2_DATST|nr:hypothetical protein [Datura stramonium]